METKPENEHSHDDDEHEKGELLVAAAEGLGKGLQAGDVTRQLEDPEKKANETWPQAGDLPEDSHDPEDLRDPSHLAFVHHLLPTTSHLNRY